MSIQSLWRETSLEDVAEVYFPSDITNEMRGRALEAVLRMSVIRLKKKRCTEDIISREINRLLTCTCC